MASTFLNNVKIDEALLYSLFINRLAINSTLFNAFSNGAFIQDFRDVTGFFPKSSQIQDPTDPIVHQTIETDNSLGKENISESQLGGVRTYRRSKLYKIPYQVMEQKRWSGNDVSAVMADIFGRHISIEAYNTALKVCVALINKSADKWTETQATASPDDLIDALAFYGENDEQWVSTVMHTATRVALFKQGYADRTPDGQALVSARDGIVYGMGRPVLFKNSDDLVVADADVSVAGAQPGKAMLFLPRGAVTISNAQVPVFRFFEDLRSELPGLVFRIDYDYIVYAKQHEWTPTDRNPTQAQVATAASWTERAMSHSNSIGFSLRVRDA